MADTPRDVARQLEDVSNSLNRISVEIDQIKSEARTSINSVEAFFKAFQHEAEPMLRQMQRGIQQLTDEEKKLTEQMLRTVRSKAGEERSKEVTKRVKLTAEETRLTEKQREINRKAEHERKTQRQAQRSAAKERELELRKEIQMIKGGSNAIEKQIDLLIRRADVWSAFNESVVNAVMLERFDQLLFGLEENTDALAEGFEKRRRIMVAAATATPAISAAGFATGAFAAAGGIAPIAGGAGLAMGALMGAGRTYRAYQGQKAQERARGAEFGLAREEERLTELRLRRLQDMQTGGALGEAVGTITPTALGLGVDVIKNTAKIYKGAFSDIANFVTSSVAPKIASAIIGEQQVQNISEAASNIGNVIASEIVASTAGLVSMYRDAQTAISNYINGEYDINEVRKVGKQRLEEQIQAIDGLVKGRQLTTKQLDALLNYQRAVAEADQLVANRQEELGIKTGLTNAARQELIKTATEQEEMELRVAFGMEESIKVAKAKKKLDEEQSKLDDAMRKRQAARNASQEAFLSVNKKTIESEKEANIIVRLRLWAEKKLEDFTYNRAKASVEAAQRNVELARTEERANKARQDAGDTMRTLIGFLGRQGHNKALPEMVKGTYDLAKATRVAKNAIDNVRDGSDSWMERLGKLSFAVTGVLGVLGTLREALVNVAEGHKEWKESTIEAGQGFAQLQRSEQAFLNLAAQRGVDNPVRLLDDIKDAAGGLIDETELVGKATKALMSDMSGNLGEALPDLIKTALVTAGAQGIEYGKQFEDLIDGIITGSTQRLDNIAGQGLINREAIADMEAKIGRQLTENEKSQLALNEALRAGKVLVEQTDEGVLNIGNVFDELTAKQQELAKLQEELEGIYGELNAMKELGLIELDPFEQLLSSLGIDRTTIEEIKRARFALGNELEFYQPGEADAALTKEQVNAAEKRVKIIETELEKNKNLTDERRKALEAELAFRKEVLRARGTESQFGLQGFAGMAGLNQVTEREYQNIEQAYNLWKQSEEAAEQAKAAAQKETAAINQQKAFSEALSSKMEILAKEIGDAQEEISGNIEKIIDDYNTEIEKLDSKKLEDEIAALDTYQEKMGELAKDYGRRVNEIKLDTIRQIGDVEAALNNISLSGVSAGVGELGIDLRRKRRDNAQDLARELEDIETDRVRKEEDIELRSSERIRDINNDLQKELRDIWRDYAKDRDDAIRERDALALQDALDRANEAEMLAREGAAEARATEQAASLEELRVETKRAIEDAYLDQKRANQDAQQDFRDAVTDQLRVYDQARADALRKFNQSKQDTLADYNKALEDIASKYQKSIEKAEDNKNKLIQAELDKWDDVETTMKNQHNLYIQQLLDQYGLERAAVAGEINKTTIMMQTMLQQRYSTLANMATGMGMTITGGNRRMTNTRSPGFGSGVFGGGVAPPARSPSTAMSQSSAQTTAPWYMKAKTRINNVIELEGEVVKEQAREVYVDEVLPSMVSTPSGAGGRGGLGIR
jgi:hypothetical protein